MNTDGVGWTLSRGRVPFRLSKTTCLCFDCRTPIVKHIFELLAEGCSLKSILRMFSDKCNLNYGEKSHWRQGKLLDILTNPIYNGHPAWKKTTTVEGKFKGNKEEWGLSEKQLPELIINSV